MIKRIEYELTIRHFYFHQIINTSYQFINSLSGETKTILSIEIAVTMETKQSCVQINFLIFFPIFVVNVFRLFNCSNSVLIVNFYWSSHSLTSGESFEMLIVT